MNKISKFESFSVHRSWLACLVGLSIIFVGGCYPIERIVYKGSVRALASCIDASSNVSVVISDDTIRRNCIEENEMSLPNWLIRPIGGNLLLTYQDITEDFRISRFRLLNIPAEYVITEVTLQIVLYNDVGEQFLVQQERSEWIEGPVELYVASLSNFDPWVVPRPEGLDLLDPDSFGGCGDAGTRTNCYIWSLSDIKGLEY